MEEFWEIWEPYVCVVQQKYSGASNEATTPAPCNYIYFIYKCRYYLFGWDYADTTDACSLTRSSPNRSAIPVSTVISVSSSSVFSFGKHFIRFPFHQLTDGRYTFRYSFALHKKIFFFFFPYTCVYIYIFISSSSMQIILPHK